MENTNPFVPVLPNGLRARISQKINELHAISAIIDSRLENIDHTQIIIPPPVPFEHLLTDGFMNPPNVFEMDDLESENESIDTPLVSPFIDLDEESDDGEVLNELNKYRNAGNLYHNRRINSIDGCDLAFPYMIDLLEGKQRETSLILIMALEFFWLSTEDDAPVVIVTKDFKGIGKTIAQTFCKAGCKVLVSYLGSLKQAQQQHFNRFVKRLRARISQEINELRAISAITDSRLSNIDHAQIIIPPPVPFEHLLTDGFMNPPNVFEMDDLESDNESIDTPLVSPFIDSDEES
ncbi:hypothetical protein Tco_0027481 [Tanacetum coccineum]